MKNNILIALERLDIGGIETFVLNQTKALVKKGKKVFILAKKGKYTKTFEQAGAHVIEFEYTDCIYYDLDNINIVKDVITKNNISEVHIHQFPCINTIMPACILTNTPYIAYCHMASGIINDPANNAYDYFERQFITYKKKFTDYFKYASKVIAITETIRKYTAERYNIPKKKMLVIPNSIDLDYFNTNRIVKNINKILLISRLSIEKKTSIINSIDLYTNLKNKIPKVELTIAGDGPIRNEIEEYIYHNNIQNVKMLGNITNVKETMEKYDLVLGVDRCILEALCLNKLAVISGYDSLKGLVTKKNINNCIHENFCGIGLKEIDIDKIVNTIISLTSQEIQEITETNHNIIKDNLDINKNIYTLDNDNVIDYDNNQIITDLYDITKIIGLSQKEYYDKAEEIWKTYKSYEEHVNRKYKYVNYIFKLLKPVYRLLRKIKNKCTKKAN